MFDNILYQQSITQALSDAIHKQEVPQALLFAGPAYSGKLSTALEFARVISCKNPQAPWNCSCTSCAQQRYLLSPYVVMLGKRYHLREIRASAASLLEEDKDGTRFLFVRSLKKLIRRFDSFLWQGDSKYSQVLKPLEQLDELMEPYNPGGKPFDADKARGDFEKILKTCLTLQNLLPRDGLNINMVRQVSWWAHTADTQYPKIVIIENAEALNETCRNSLLKILEEPPPRVYFILLAEQKQSIMPTILSRLRVLNFSIRSSEQEKELIKRVFRQKETDFTGLKDFFTQHSAWAEQGGLDLALKIQDTLLREAGLAFMAKGEKIQDLSHLIDQLPADRQDQIDIFKNLLENLSGLLRPSPVLEQNIAKRELPDIAVFDSLQRLYRTSKEGILDMIHYNISGASCLERVYSHAGDGPCAVLYKEL